MIFKKIFNSIWLVFDVVCFVLALIFIDFGAFLILVPVGYICTGLSFAFLGWLSERISDSKGGGH
ncbi:DUF1056 family protein [Oenococcus alcoholitolerans]|uniref:DUF1056 family protein n=1 Tax=Oenococcus alcoholitolerans TaxID=931074 RepID=UPI003F711E1E